MLRVKAHVLRYWETQFSMLRPKKNRAGNRMYRPEEVRLLIRIKELLYDRRFTIAGARRTLLDARKQDEPQVELGFTEAERKLLVAEVKEEMRSLLARLKRDAIIMHPLPRGPEIDPAVDQDPRAMYWRQERNGMWMRAAVLAKIFSAEQRIREIDAR